MKAINITTFNKTYLENGDVSTLKFNPSQAIPIPTATQALVQVHAACICPYELTWMLPGPAMPHRIPCHDIAGTIVSCPASSTFSAGDRVFGLLDYSTNQGGMAEYVAAETKMLAKMPEGLDFIEAASIPRSALTIWQAINEHNLSAKAGSEVLVTGASGAAGRMAVQILRDVVGETGKIIAVGGTGSRDLKSLGADIVIHHSGVPDWSTTIGKVDVVFDCIGGSTLEKCLPLTKDNGRVLTIGTPPPNWDLVKGWKEAEKRGVTGALFIVHWEGAQLAEIGRLWKEGKLKPSVGFVVDGLTEERVRDGWSRGLKGGISGSVVVRIM